MASVSGLLQVRVRQAKGLDAAPAAALTVRLRLLPWKEEQSSDTAQCDDDGTAEWALSDANLVVLPHLAAHDEAEPQLSIDLRSRELLVYERCLGVATIDAQPLLIPGEENEMWISLNEKTSVLLTTKFQPGTTTPSNIARTPSLVLNEAGRHQHLFRLQSYNTPQWCAVCERMMMGLRHQGFRCEACGLSVHGGCQLKAHAVFDCVGKKPPPLETPQPSFDEPLVRSRRPVVLWCLPCDSCPSHHEVGGLFFDFEAIQTVSSEYDAPRRCKGLRGPKGPRRATPCLSMTSKKVLEDWNCICHR